MKEVARMHVWSNGKTIRAYRSQDKRWDNVRRTSEKGYRKMIAVLYEMPEIPGVNPPSLRPDNPQ